MFAALALLALPFTTSAGVTKIITTVVDPAVTGYATFQSHNQKVVANPHGIFITCVRTRNEDYTAQQWRLMRSADGGATFSIVHEAQHATNPPVIETDSDGNVFLGYVDFVSGDAYLMRFDRALGYRGSLVARIPGGAAGKYAMHLDEKRGCVYWFAHNGAFARVEADTGKVTPSSIIKDGPDAALQYPSLSLAPDGALHAAWTTVRHGEYLYWDIHHMLTTDGGATWRAPGDPAAMTVPIIADQHGPAPRITLDDEFGNHTWLSSFLVSSGKLHFLYLAQTQPPRQHYVRCDAATGRKEMDIQPELKGATMSLRGLDGFFAARPSLANSPLYCVLPWNGRIACLASDDNGATWYDYAVSDDPFSPYALGGCREITSDGWVIGTFTDMNGEFANERNRLVFLRFRAGLCRADVVSLKHGGGQAVIRFGRHWGQPAMVRVRARTGSWSPWTRFAPSVRIRSNAAPDECQLRSRLGTTSEPFGLPRSEGVGKP